MATRSMLAAVSGINANQTYLDEIANNIANADTIGYEQGTVLFGDLLAEQVTGATAPTAGSGGVDPVAVGSGVRVSSVMTDTAEGTLESTGNPTDVAITGNGFLVVQEAGQQLYTRDGALTVDATGQLTTMSGALVQGWEAQSTGAITNNAPVGAISIPTGETIAAQTTTQISLDGNLPAWNGTPSTKPTSIPQITVDAYTPLGAAVPVVLTFTPTGPNTWKLKATATETKTTGGTMKETTVTLLTTTIKFKPTGALTTTGLTPTGAGYKLTMTTGTATSFTQGKIALFLPGPTSSGAVTQFSGAQTIEASQNGFSSGALESYSISSTGVITGAFSNGKTMPLGQIALASFANASGLEDVGNGLLAVSANSGQAEIGVAGTGVRGQILGGQLEESNVNLGTQLTDLITAQEAYEANTKAIATSQQVIASLEQV